MSNQLINKCINIAIILILIGQFSILLYNSKTTYSKIQNKNISIENFSSIVLSKYGITSFGSEKLSKKNKNLIFLEGISYLENDFYKIYGKDINLDLSTETSSSDKAVEVINYMGTMKSEGFKNEATIGVILFYGKSSFYFDD